MTRIITGTASVDPGGSIVTAWSNTDGVTLSEITAPASSTVVIEGRANFIKTRLSTTSFELMLPHAGDGGTGLDCAVSALTAGETQIGTLNARTATVIQQLGVLDANGRGLFYNLIGSTGDNDPGPGRMAFNNADPELVTELYLDVLDANEGGRDVTGIMGLWATGTVLIVRSLASAAYAAFQLAAPPVAPAGYRRAAVSFVGGDGTLAQEPVGVEWLMPGTDKDVDAQVADIAGRAAFDEAPEGFRILVENAGGGVAVRYAKLSAAAGHWSPGARYTGPVGATGPFTDISFGPTTTLPAGSAATATVVEIGPGAIRIDLGLPRGLDGTGTGDMVGPAGATDGAFVGFNGPTGKITKELTSTVATSMLNTFAVTLKGLVPATTAPDVAAGRFLRADGAWALPSGLPVGGAARQVLRKISATDGDAGWANAVGFGAAVNASSGASLDFTGIPPGCRRITLQLIQVSTNGNANYIVQLGSTTIQATGYFGAAGNTAATDAYTTGFGIRAGAGTVVMNGIMTLERVNGNTWAASGSFGRSDAASISSGGGSVTLAGELDRVRLTTVGGADAFDSGLVNITFE